MVNIASTLLLHIITDASLDIRPLHHAPWREGHPAAPGSTPGGGLACPSSPRGAGTWPHTSPSGPARRHWPPALETVSSLRADTASTQSVNTSHDWQRWSQNRLSWGPDWGSAMVPCTGWWMWMLSVQEEYFVGNTIPITFWCSLVHKTSGLYCWDGPQASNATLFQTVFCLKLRKTQQPSWTFSAQQMIEYVMKKYVWY